MTARDAFANYDALINSMSAARAQKTAGERSQLEGKEKSEDMTKNVGEVKLFTSMQGVQKAIKPFKAAIKKAIKDKVSNVKDSLVQKLKDKLGLGEDGPQELAQKNLANAQDDLASLKSQNAENEVDRLKNEAEAAPEEQDALRGANDLDRIAESDAEDAAASKVGDAESALNDIQDITKPVSSSEGVMDTLKAGFSAAKTVGQTALADAKSDASAAIEKQIAKVVATSAAEEEADAPLDAIPGADIVGVIIGAAIAGHAAHKIHKLMKEDRNLGPGQTSGVSSQLGV